MAAGPSPISSRLRQKSPAGSNRKPELVLVDKRYGEPLPALSVYLTDSSLKPLSEARVDERGRFELSEEAAKQACFIVIAPQGEKAAVVNPDFALLFRSKQLLAILRRSNTIELARPRWERLLPFPSWLVSWHHGSGRTWPRTEDRKGKLASQAEATRFCRISRELPPL